RLPSAFADRPFQRHLDLVLLDEAAAAFNTPVSHTDGAVGVLVTLRESIDAMFGELLRRRRVREKTPSDSEKVLSLGRHGARPLLPPGHFTRLALEIEPLRKQLSPAKQTVIPQERMREMFHTGVEFLIVLMDGIDETRLNPP